MTLSHPSQYRRQEEISLLMETLENEVCVESETIDRVKSLGNTTENPTLVTSPRARAREIADDVQAIALDKAKTRTDDTALAEEVSYEFGERAYESALASIIGSPYIEVDA